MFNFGAGRARLIPAGGGNPIELGVVNAASLDLRVDLKELRGAFRYPIAVADGRGTASGQISFMQLWPQALAAVLGGTQLSSTPQAVIAEQGTAATNSYTLVNGSTMVPGSEIVIAIIAGNPVFYSRVATAPASATTLGVANGTYSITGAGVITFAVADATVKLTVSYLYTPAAAINNSAVALQQVGMNSALTFQLTLIGTGKNIYTNQAQQFIVQLNACLAPSLRFNFKLDDFTDVQVDYQAFIDANGNLGTFFLVNP